MLRKCSAAALILGIIFAIGCATHVHKVGDGPQGDTVVESRQWYVLFGLVPINDVDTKAMASGASDYEIMTQSNLIDIIIGAFVGAVSINSRTVTVRK